MQPAPPSAFETPGLRQGTVLVTEDGEGVAAALVEQLELAGLDAQLASDSALAHAGAVLCLSGLRALPPHPVEAAARADAINFEAFATARSVAARFAAEGGTFITVQDTGGDFGLSGSARAAVAGPAALARTAAVEWPRAIVRALDVEALGRNPREVAAVIARELLHGGPEVEVGLRAGGARQCVVLREAPLPQDADLLLTAADVAFVVATGGARGVTAACLLELARQAPGRFLLLGRTPIVQEPAACLGARSESEIKRALALAAQQAGAKPDLAAIGRQAQTIVAGREIAATLAAFAALGSEARYAVVDATDAEAVAAAIAEKRAIWGPVTAVVHGAGVLADKLIAEKSDAQYERVTRTKVAALRALLAATAADPLRHLMLFSSVAARSGNLGQCDYAMANEILNKVAAQEKRRRSGTCTVRALGWGPWDGGMVDEGLKARFARMNVSLIGIAEGARAFVQEWHAQTDPASEVVLGADAGAPSLAGPTGAQWASAVRLSASSHAFPDGHRIKGVPVAPVALVVEWFARMCRAVTLEQQLPRIRNVRVLRGLPLAGFDHGEVETVTVRASVLPEARGMALELRSESGALLYTADAILEAGGTLGAPAVGKSDARSSEPLEPIYGRAPLFHGPSFMMLSAVKSDATSALTGDVRGVHALGWSPDRGTWCLDPAIIDAGLQLALLWAYRALTGSALPTGIEEVVVHRAGAATGKLQAALLPRTARGARGVCDVLFTDDGVPVLELRGVEVHVVAPAEASATAEAAALSP